MIVYLDQNYASRIAKHLLGLPHHAHYGVAWAALQAADVLAPPSPFHVLELHGGYLAPVFERIFALLGDGFWVRPWQEVLHRQYRREGLWLEDCLGREGGWDRPADLAPLWGLLDLELEGSFVARTAQVAEAVTRWVGLKGPRARALPFVQVLARLVALRSLEATRRPRLSDLVDLVMAATLRPYVSVLATDRYLKEALTRLGYGQGVYSGRRREVLRLAADLARGAWEGGGLRD